MDTTPGLNSGIPRLGVAQVRTVVFGAILTIFLGALDQTIVVTALPSIGRDLGTLQNLSWVVTAYFLAAIAVTPLYGKLSDIYGRRPMVLVGIGLFTAGSVACALAPTMAVLILARGLQGLGGGALISLAQTIIADVVSPRERGRYQGYIGGTFALASVAGPVLGGVLSEHLHWSFIFWINLPLAALAYAMTSRVLKLLPAHHRRHSLDVLGAMLMTIATVSLMLALTWAGTTYPWLSPQILGLVALSAIVWGLFAMRLRTAVEPFIPLALLANPVLRRAMAVTFFGVGAMIGTTVYMPLYFELSLGFDSASSGMALIPLMTGVVVGATIAGQLMVRVARYKRMPIAGLACAAAAAAVLALRAGHAGTLEIEVLLGLMGVGIGTHLPVMTVSVQNAVDIARVGTATSLLNFFRSLGSAVLVTALGTIFLVAVGLPDIAAASIETLVAEAGRQAADFAFAFRCVFLAVAASLIIALALLLGLEERPLRETVAG